MHFIISGVQALGGCHRLRIFCEPALKPWLWSHLRLDVVGSWGEDRFQAHWRACWKAPVPRHMGISTGCRVTWLLASQGRHSERGGDTMSIQDGSQGLYNLFLQDAPSAYLVCQKWVSRSDPHSRGRDYTRVWVPGGGDRSLGAILEAAYCGEPCRYLGRE